MKADFSGWATKHGLKCSDGRTIMDGAFKHQDQMKVPLVWQHQHSDSDNVLGHAILEHRDAGVYAHAFFNKSDKAQNAKIAVEHGDIDSLSIYANKLQEQNKNVLHGDIKEVSLVLSGANPGAIIDNVYLRHGDTVTTIEGEAIMYFNEGLVLEHSEEESDVEELDVQEVLDSLDDDQQEVVHGLLEAALTHSEDGPDKAQVQAVFESLNEDQQIVVHAMIEEALAHAKDSAQGGKPMATETAQDKTIKDIFDAMSDEQKNVVYFMIGEAIDTAGGETDSTQHADTTEFIAHAIQEGFDNMSRNVFDQSNNKGSSEGQTLTHAQVQEIVADGVKNGSLKESFLSHVATYGFENTSYLFPEVQNLSGTPETLTRRVEWVPKVLDATKHAPFARIKSVVADLTADEARAKGYIKGNEKKDEVVQLMRRTTMPTTVYKKQKLDRDDIIDITDFDVVAWLKWEIRFMLDEEIARAILIGDGRSALSEDKIKDPIGAIDGTGIRSIANDHDLYAHKVDLAANVAATDIIDGITRSLVNYRGSGNPSLYTTNKVLTELLVLKDKMGRRLYESESALASALRVKEIIAVEVLEEIPTILGIVTNLVDYTIGANKGGELTFFDFFDIDFNQNKYLMETRISGALTKPKSAVIIRRLQGTLATVVAPSFNGPTNTITVPTSTGIKYLINDAVVTGSVVITHNTTISAEALTGYYITPGTTTDWTFTYTP